MHMADALISPAVGGTLWVVSGGMIAYSARKIRESVRDDLVPMMGVLGAFIFAAQMINFTIPGTGSSGHLGGGLMLAALLGPHAAFLVMASVLCVQALFFADGGLMALGCNIFNIGFIPAYIAYPLYRTITRNGTAGSKRIWIGAMLAALIGLQIGAFGVVLQTTLSGIAELPFKLFSAMMMPIHLAIGLVEGLATAAVIGFMARVRPELFTQQDQASQSTGLRRVVFGTLLVAACLGGLVSWFASSNPDGLEWSIAKVAGTEELETTHNGLPARLEKLQAQTAFMPDYDFKETASTETAEEETTAWSRIQTGTSLSGLAGGLITLLISGLIGLALKLCMRQPVAAEPA